MKPRRHRASRSLHVHLTAVLAIGLGQLDAATPYFWDTNGTATGPGTAPSGTWGTDSYWNTSLTGDAGTFTSSTTSTDALYFSATPGWAGTVNISGTANANTVVFDQSQAIGITGGTLNQVGGITVNNGTVSISSIISGAGGVTVSGSGRMLTLSNASNTYLGVTRISGGATLEVTSMANGGLDSSLGKSESDAANLVLAGTLKFIGTADSTTDRLFTIAGLGVTNALNSSGMSTIAFTNAGYIVNQSPGVAYILTLTGDSTGPNKLAPVLKDNNGIKSAIAKNGTGTWEITSTQEYSNGTTINAGILKLGHASNTLLDTGSVTILSGTLSLGTNSDTVGYITLAGGAIESTTGQLTGSTYDFQKGSVSAILAGAGQVVKTTTDTVTLTGANTYTGNTDVRQGTLVLAGGDNRLLSSGLVNIGAVATAGKLMLGDATAASNQTLNGLTTAGLGGSVVGGNSANSILTLNVASGNSTFSDVLGGAGTHENKLSLVKTGSDTLQLNGVNTYTGDTTIKAGTLKLGAGGTVANSQNLKVGDAGSSGTVLDLTAKVGSGFTIATGQTLSGIGTVDIDDGATKGTMTIAGTHSPGNSPGVQPVEGNLSYASGSVFVWELTANNTDLSNYDRVTGNGGTLNFDAGSKISLIFNLTESSVDFSTTFWTINQSWPIFTGFAANPTGSFTVDWATITQDSLGHTYSNYPADRPGGGYFSMSGTTLTWNAVPEPGNLMAGVLLAAGLLRRRRQHK